MTVCYDQVFFLKHFLSCSSNEFVNIWDRIELVVHIVRFNLGYAVFFWLVDIYLSYIIFEVIKVLLNTLLNNKIT